MKKNSLKVLNFIITIIFIIAIMGQYIVNAQEHSLKLYASSALIMDGDNARVLWEQKGKERRAMASTTKIMTCIVALENGNLKDEVVVSKKASLAPEVKLFIKEGEKYILEDLLYALMLESSNDVAVTIAEHVGSSVEEFCNMMTQKAIDIGAFDTSYKTPNGLDADGHYTTAYDLALITRYALKNEQFINIINTKQREFYETTKKRQHSVNNKNRFLDLMDGACGVKTGFTCKAGYCFVGAVKKDGKYFISVVLASGWPPNRSWKWKDTLKIMNYALKTYNYKLIMNGKEQLPDLDVIDGKQKKVSLFFEGTLGMLLSNDEKIDKKLQLPNNLVAPIKNNNVIGYFNIYVNDQLYQKIPIKTAHSIEKIDFRYCFDIIIKYFMLNKR